MAQFKRATTTDLITNGKYSNAATNTIIETLGYTTKGDGGGALWKKTGNTITASQTPTNTANGTCSDAAGNEFSLVLNSTSANVLAFGAIGSDISPVIQTALNSGVATKYHLQGSYTALTHISCTKSDVTLDLTNCSIDATNLAYDSSFQGGGAWLRFSGSIALNTGITADITAGDTSFTFTSVSGIQVGDIVRLHSTEPVYTVGAITDYKFDINRIIDITGSVVTLDYPVTTDWDGTTYVISVEVIRPLRNCHVIGGDILGGGLTESPLANGRGQSAVFFYGVDGCSVKRMETNDLYANALSTERCINVLFAESRIIGRPFDEVIVEGTNSSWYGMYSIRSRNIVMRDNYFLRCRHSCDATSCQNVSQVNNFSSDSHKAAYGSHNGVYNLLIDGNICDSGSSGITIRAFSSIVTNNAIYADNALTTSNSLYTDTAGELTISNNTIESTAGACISLTGKYDYLEITNNPKLKGTSSSILIGAPSIIDWIIKGNKLEGTVGLEIDTATVDLDELNGLHISDNIFRGYTGNALELRGATNASLPAEHIKILDNLFLPSVGSSGAGILLRSSGYFGEYVVIRGNSQFGDSSITVQIQAPRNFSAYPVVELNDQDNKLNFINRTLFDSTTNNLGTGATVLRGGVVNRTLPSVAQPTSWICVASGTDGTVTGVTGDITTGTPTLTLTGNDSTKVLPGMYITVTGAGVAAADLDARILSITDDLVTATLDTNASTTVVGAAVNYDNPTFGVVSTIA